MWLSPKDIAEELRVSVSTVQRWIRQGRLRAYRLSYRGYRVRREDLDDFLERHATIPPTASEGGQERKGE